MLGNVAEWVTAMTVERLGGAPGTPGPPASGELGPDEQSPAAAGDPLPVQVLIKILKEGVDQVFLKQFRDVGEPPTPAAGPPAAVGTPEPPPGKACYQRLVQARVKFVDPKVKLKLEPWRVTLGMGPDSSCPIQGDLGLQKVSTTPFSFELTSGLKLESGRLLV